MGSGPEWPCWYTAKRGADGGFIVRRSPQITLGFNGVRGVLRRQRRQLLTFVLRGNAGLALFIVLMGFMGALFMYAAHLSPSPSPF
jgi:hypothetical protein